MGWFNRRSRDLIADANIECDRLRDVEVQQRLDMNDTLHGGKLVVSEGWCAPSDVIYDLPEVSIRRGGIKWPTA